ncbi:MAG TPA: TetR/AcrR family transcriptional regulator [Solirubrobacterales bacterium]|nr:TetR/AcrR family transcriptional regulator [Solirubrobacterales bacterium]
MKKKDPTGKRPYRMQARAQSTAATKEKVLDSAEAALDEHPGEEPTLSAIADRAGVTVQTILRHFGSKQALLVAAIGRLGARMRSDRDRAPVGDVKGAVGILVDHYETYGDRILRMLANEGKDPVLHVLVDLGRAYHQEWCEHVFAPALTGLHAAKRERRISQLVAITDIYFWKLLRRDRDLSLPQTKRAMRELLDPLIEGDR